MLAVERPRAGIGSPLGHALHRRRRAPRSSRIVSAASIHGRRLVAAGSGAAPSGSTINRVGCVRRRRSQITLTMPPSTDAIAPSAGQT
jgi:hypothetical protein